MIDIILDSLLDTLKILPFLFITFLAIELIEHKFSEKTEKLIKKSGKTGPIVGGVLGAIPQCGFSVAATNLYITRIISLGTLISIYLSTSDEMLPVLLSSGANFNVILKIVLIKIVIGIIAGIVIDSIYHPKKKKHIHDICEHDHCDCEHNILKSSIIHTLKTIIFILIVNFILNVAFNYLGENVLSKLLLKDTFVSPFISSLIGLIPNCGASIMLTTMYLNNTITLNTCISGLLTGTGIAIAVLFKSNKNIKENISIIILIYLIGSISGLLLNLLGGLL